MFRKRTAEHTFDLEDGFLVKFQMVNRCCTSFPLYCEWRNEPLHSRRRPFWILRKMAAGNRPQLVCDGFWNPYAHTYHHAKFKKLGTKCTIWLNSGIFLPRTPANCNILVITSKLSNYFNKRMSLNGTIIFSTVFCIDTRSFKWQFSYLWMVWKTWKSQGISFSDFAGHPELFFHLLPVLKKKNFPCSHMGTASQLQLTLILPLCAIAHMLHVACPFSTINHGLDGCLPPA